MLIDLKRTHDFQVFISPKNNETALTNPPSFNWPENETVNNYYLIIENINDNQTWTWGDVHSPFQLNFKFDIIVTHIVNSSPYGCIVLTCTYIFSPTMVV